MSGFRKAFALAIIAVVVAGACAGGSAPGGPLTKVRLQLQWVAQSQFAGFFAAVNKGYYKDLGLDVEIKLGGPDIVPQQVVASDGAEFGIAWVPKMLASREAGADLVDIAQYFQRSGTLEVAFKDKNITKPEDWKGKKVGTWGFGNEPELYAAMRKAGIDPTKASDVTIVKQPFDMSLLLNGDVDAAQAMIYNEYAQVLEQKNPKTGQLYQPNELNVVDFNQVGTAMLQDHIFVRSSWLAKTGNEDIATKFLQASFKGWIFCRDTQKECVDIVLKAGTTLGAGRYRRAGHRVVGPDGQHLGQLPGLEEQTDRRRLPNGSREEGRRRAEGAGRGHHRLELQESGRGGDPGRKLVPRA